MRSIIFTLLVLIAIVNCDLVKTTSCFENPTLTVDAVDVNPVIAKPGDNVTSIIKGTANKEVTGGKLTVEVFLRTIRLFAFTYDLCKIGTCPVTGPYTATVVQNVPKIALSGVYSTKNTAVDAAGNILSCVQFDFQVKK
ncbi:phosphatidylinositol/phosphatidylglycerol transfer protein [Acrasis kona]|uniref:Phosphatidylinositol/phosphatidylglycerol transfer protein n=1 Tax=Acrasis kona TaxID=1008807 RepID=A0AAW2ZNM7_9EUKA